jgi:hypothetical protein
MKNELFKGLRYGIVISLFLWVVIIFATISFVGATTYYVNQSGSDSNNCSTIALSCKTITKANTLNLTAGDSILFARNEVWRTLTDARPNLTSNILYGAYGTGNQPMFLGSLNGSNMTWINKSNVWNVTGITYDVGNIIFNATTSFGSGFGSGNKTSSYAGLLSMAEERSFYYDSTNDVFYLYFTEDDNCNTINIQWIYSDY